MGDSPCDGILWIPCATFSSQCQCHFDIQPWRQPGEEGLCRVKLRLFAKSPTAIAIFRSFRSLVQDRQAAHPCIACQDTPLGGVADSEPFFSLERNSAMGLVGTTKRSCQPPATDARFPRKWMPPADCRSDGPVDTALCCPVGSLGSRAPTAIGRPRARIPFFNYASTVLASQARNTPSVTQSNPAVRRSSTDALDSQFSI